MEEPADFGERAPVKARQRPPRPSAAEIAEQEATHYPYRVWCRHCVMGEGRRDQHRGSGQADGTDEIPFVAGDYGFFTDGHFEADHGASPILIAEHWSKEAVLSEVVLAKGRDQYAIEVLSRWLTWIGDPELKLRSDGELPISALMEGTATEK